MHKVHMKSIKIHYFSHLLKWELDENAMKCCIINISKELP